MLVTIKPSTLNGTLYAPVSKSLMQRACAAALLKKGRSILSNPGKSNDDKATLSVIKSLGANYHYSNNKLIIDSDGVNPVSEIIDCGESGLCTRMFTPVAALSEKRLLITGSGSLLNRPVDFFDKTLPQLSVYTESNDGKLPLNINGPLQPENITIDGGLSSQFLTGLLMAYASINIQKDFTINVENLKSKPYIDLTLSIIEAFGLNSPVNEEYKRFTFHPSNKTNQNKEIQYTIEGDWSGASFLLVAGAISGNITLKGLDVFSSQADKSILQALMSSGSQISIQEDQIEIRKSYLKPFYFDATDCPDLFPPLVALATYCDGKSVIKGTDRLTHKESNRSLTLQEEFKKMGIEILLQDDLMIIKGGTEILGAKINSHHDHRIAMACTIAALGANGSTTIENADAVYKSYPDFFEDLKNIGAIIHP